MRTRLAGPIPVHLPRLAGRVVRGAAVAAVLAGCASGTTARADTATGAAGGAGSFTLTSPVMVEGGTLPAEFTCDGASHSPPLAWRGAPPGTESLAVVMHHVPGPGEVHWYWVLYDLAPGVTHLDAARTPPATVGTNSVDGRTAYAPPCSKGPGAKTYTFTVYALARRPTLPAPEHVSRRVLLDAIGDITLGSATLHVTYTRPANADPATPPPGGRTP